MYFENDIHKLSRSCSRKKELFSVVLRTATAQIEGELKEILFPTDNPITENAITQRRLLIFSEKCRFGNKYCFKE